jgi:hypothetical protein
MSPANAVDYSQLFLLDDPVSSRYLRLSNRQDRLSIDKEILVSHGDLQPPKPLVMKGYMGGQITDILWSGSILVCVSQKVIDILLDNRFSGWSTFPVEVYDRRNNYLPGYYGFAIPSFVGDQELKRSEIITKPPNGVGGETYTVYKGVYFDESKWDGSDFFRITEGFIAVTKRVKDAFTKDKIKNIEFTPLPDVEIMTAVFDIRNKHIERTQNKK